MPDWKKLAALGGRAGRAVTGGTAAQEWLGGLGLVKNAVTGNASNLRLGPNAEVMYDSADPNAAASAMGSFVRTNPGSGADADVLKHEMRHVAQSDALGPLFLPGAISEQFADYGAGPMEGDAIRHATPQSEIMRKGSSMYQPPAKPAAHAFLRALLGGR
jgi:hypothetical protein